MKHRRINHSLCHHSGSHGGYLYLTGGKLEEKFMKPAKGFDPSIFDHVNGVVKYVERFNLKSEVWEDFPALIVRRYSHASCTVKESLYVFCGRNEQ